MGKGEANLECSLTWAVSLSPSRGNICQEDDCWQKVCWRGRATLPRFYKMQRCRNLEIQPYAWCHVSWVGFWYWGSPGSAPRPVFSLFPQCCIPCQKVSRHTDIYTYVSASFGLSKVTKKNAEGLLLAFFNSVYSQPTLSVVLHVTTLQTSCPDDNLAVVSGLLSPIWCATLETHLLFGCLTAGLFFSLGQLCKTRFDEFCCLFIATSNLFSEELYCSCLSQAMGEVSLSLFFFFKSVWIIGGINRI